MSTTWTDESKADLIDKYLKAEPTPNNSMEIVNDLAEEFDTTANAVRMILSRAGVYVKKEAVKSGKTNKGTEDKPARVSKADAIAGLQEAIETAGQSVDEEILSKLTGKAAMYFTGVIKGIATED